MSETIRKYKNLSNEDLGNLYLDMLHWRGVNMLEKIIYFFKIRPRCNCRGFCVLCRFYKKCSYEMGVQKYCERKLRN